MDELKLKQFLEDEILEMKKYRIEKNIEAGKDLGQEPSFEWITKNSKSFRDKWFYKHKGG